MAKVRSKSELRPSQDRAVTYLYEHDQVQAVMPMGSGKTVTALTALDELQRDLVVRCALVIAPKRVAHKVWPDEVKEWEHLLDKKVVVIRGNEKERLAALAQDADVYSVGINHVPWLMDLLRSYPTDHKLFDLLIFDESSKLKDPRGTWGKKLMGIARRWKNKWWLTGTPRPNSYLDQFRPLATLTGGRLWGTTQFDKWRVKHFMPLDYQERQWEIRPEHEAKIIRKIQSVSFTIADEDMPELPELHIVPHWVDLPASQRPTYERMWRDLVATLKDGEDIETILAANEAVATGKLAQFLNGFMYNDAGEAIRVHDEKMEKTLELVEALDGNPALVVYEFIEDLRRIREEWPGMPNLGNGTKDADADRFIDEWNAGKLELLGMHPGSAAHGLNMQHGGNHMIVYGFPWSAELFDQMVKRIHRSGQKERCYIHLILFRDTVDEIKYERVFGKIEEQEAFRQKLRKV